MFERILVPLDGTEHAEHALQVAARIAHVTNGTLIVVGSVLPSVAVGTDEVSRAGELHSTQNEVRQEYSSSYLDEVLQRHAPELEGIKTEKVVAAGVTQPPISEEARLQDADLIVLCSQGEGGLKSRIFGDRATQAVRHSPVPILVLKKQGVFPPFSLQERLLRVLVPLDGSPLSETALEPTLQLMAALAGSTQLALHLLEVVNIPYPYGNTRAFSNVDKMMEEEEIQKAQCYLHDEMSRLLAQLPTKLNLTMTYSVVTGLDVARAIRDEVEPAKEELEAPPYDLIALTTHGWGELRRLLVGSVTEQLLRTCRLPLFIVRPPKVVREEKQEQSREAHPGENARVHL